MGISSGMTSGLFGWESFKKGFSQGPLQELLKQKPPLIIVSRGDWLGNPANFKESCLCLRFYKSRDIDRAQTFPRWRPIEWKSIFRVFKRIPSCPDNTFKSKFL